MKTLFRVLVLGAFLTAIGILSSAAQEQECADLAACFEKFKVLRKAECGNRGPALTLGKMIIEKYGNDELNKEVIDYVKKQVATIEKEDPDCKRITDYNAAYKAKDWPKFTTLSKELIAKEGNSPLGLDVMLTLVSVGFDRAVEKVDTYNNDTLNYAKQAIQRIEAGGTSQTGNWGTFNGFKTKTYPDGKTNSLNWMNYIIGYVNYYRLGATDPAKKKEGLDYLYKSTLFTGDNKNDVSIYTNIGSWYFDQVASLDKQYRDMRAANNNTETDEAKALRAKALGYADRGIDAFARGRKLAIENKGKQPQIDAISKTLTDLYKFRFNLAPDAKTPDLDKYVADMLAKPMPDPATDVTPVVEEVKPATTTSTTPTTTTPNTTKPTTPTNTKSSSTTTPTKQPTSSTTNDQTTEATTATKTTPAKKPVTKKKGTR